MSLCLGKNIYLPQSTTQILLAFLPEGSCSPDPGVLKRFQCWKVDVLKFFIVDFCPSEEVLILD